MGKKHDFIQQKINLDDACSLLDFFKYLSPKDAVTLVKVVLSPQQEIQDFDLLFSVRVAAGGWVFGPNGQLLMIKRNGIWDIPKGHLEPNEDLSQCALREVQEETGVVKLKITNYLGISRHIFKEKGQWIMKLTHWYKMEGDSSEKLWPQHEEGIDSVEWINESEVPLKLQKAWPSLKDFYQTMLIKP